MIDEQRNIVYSGLIFIICYVFLAVIAMSPVYSYDGFWHLQMGQDLWEKGLSPWLDHYSFSYSGKEISTIPVLFQVLLYQFVNFFGENEGFYFIKLFYVTLMMLVLFVYFRKIKVNWFIILVLLPLITYVIQLRLMIRPEIFSNILVVLCLLLYIKAKKSFAAKELLLICLLLLFWSNYHSPVFGYVIIFGLFLDKAINKYFNGDHSFSWKWWFSWGVVIFLIGFIRPNGNHFIITMFHLMSEDFSKYTQEYVKSYPLFSRNIIVHISWLLSIYVALWSLFKRQYGFAFIAVVLVYFSLSTLRLVSITILINLCIMALYFSQLNILDYVGSVRKSVRYLAVLVAAGISSLAFYNLSQKAIDAVNENEDQTYILETRYPVQLVDYLERYQDGGNILNVMDIGGYLLRKLSPEYKVYFDGRTNILYPIEFLKYNLEILKNSHELNKTIEHYNVKYALYRNTPEIFSQLQKAESLNLAFADESYLLFARSKINAFPLLSTLMVFPSCWRDEWYDGIQEEISRLEALLENRNYTINSVIAFMKDYLSTKNKKRFFEDLNKEELRSDAVQRIALHFALESGNYKAASVLFPSIQKKTEYDVLIYIYYLAENGEYDRSEELLYYFYQDAKFVKKKRVSFDKIAIMIRALKVLEENSALKHFESSYIGELEDKLKKANYHVEDAMSFGYMCEKQ